MRKYILWDFDNTLAYREGMWAQTIFDLLLENGHNNVDLKEISKQLTTGFPWHSSEISHKEFLKGASWWEYMNVYFSNIIKKLGFNDLISKSISEKIKDKYLETKYWHVYDDVVPCLVQLIRNGYEHIIVSNHVPELEKLVGELGLRQYFTSIYTSAKIGYEKPNIEIFRKVINQLDSSDITMIGDSYHADIQGALNAGIAAILVRKDNFNNYDRYSNNLINILEILNRL